MTDMSRFGNSRVVLPPARFVEHSWDAALFCRWQTDANGYRLLFQNNRQFKQFMHHFRILSAKVIHHSHVEATLL